MQLRQRHLKIVRQIMGIQQSRISLTIQQKPYYRLQTHFLRDDQELDVPVVMQNPSATWL